MCEVEIKLNTIDDVKNLVSEITKSECDFEIISSRFVVDAKSIMGIFSLDLSKKLMLVIQSDDECELSPTFAHFVRLEVGVFLL